MKTVKMIWGKSNQSVNIRTRPNDDVLGYAICVDEWTDMPRPFKRWPGTDAEKPKGVSFTLGAQPVRGYDVVLRSAVRRAGEARIFVEILLDNKSVWADAVDFPADEGPVVKRDVTIYVD